MNMQKLKPAVPRCWLLLLAGLTWSLVGLMLCRFSVDWLLQLRWSWSLPLGVTGILLSVAVYRFGLKRCVKRNIVRISHSSEKVCLFAFQAWRSYLMIPPMVAMGLVLRGSTTPRHYLAIPYMMMGFSLFLSSFHYYSSFWRNLAC